MSHHCQWIGLPPGGCDLEWHSSLQLGHTPKSQELEAANSSLEADLGSIAVALQAYVVFECFGVQAPLITYNMILLSCSSRTDYRTQNAGAGRDLANLASAPCLAIGILRSGKGVTCLNKSLSWD